MTSRRTYSGAQPTLVANRDDAEPACDRSLVDVVWKGGAAAKVARATLFEMCGPCALRPTCWADKAWRDALRGKVAKPEPIPCGDRLTDEGRAKIRANNTEHMVRFNADRLADLKVLAAAGTTAGQAAKQFGIERETLRMWCYRHGHMDLWKRLQGVAA